MRSVYFPRSKGSWSMTAGRHTSGMHASMRSVMPIFSAISKGYRRIPVKHWSDEMHDLLLEIYAAVDGAPESAGSLTPVEIEEFQRRFDRILENGKAENPPSPLPVQEGRRGRKRRTPAENLIDRCQKYRVEILRFMTDFRVPFTNNLAERDIRMVKVQQKISGTSQLCGGGI